MFLTYERFKHYMDKVVRQDEAVTAIWNILNEDVIDSLSPAQNALIELLEELMDDGETSWICYWLYDLDKGAKYTEGCITIDDVPVPLVTLEDLYNLLKDNYKRKIEEKTETFTCL